MQKYTIGLDIGGTKIAAGAVDSRGKIVKKITIPTEASRGKKIILKNILTAASKVWVPGAKALGIAMAGQCDFKNGVFLSGPNFPKNFRNINIAKLFETAFRVPASLDNDARAFTLAEGIYGAGRGKKNIVGLTLGTGIGSGIIIDGKILRGENNTAGEIGHMTIDASSTFRCGCGRTGHFEALASGTALENFYEKYSGKFLPGAEIAKKIIAGDKNAKLAVAKISEYLGLGLANIAHIFNPEIIIVGGGGSATPTLWPAALQGFKKAVIYNSLQKTKIVKANLGGDAGIIGAALLAEKK